MSDGFWKHPDWTRMERGALAGDAMRGLPRNDFPWNVATESFVDAEGDAWTVEVHCHAVEHGKKPATVKATLGAKASCTVADTNLERMGLSPQRLRAMHEGNATFEETGTREIELPIDGIEKHARAWISALRGDLLIGVTFNRKQKLLWEKVRARPVSPFARVD